MSIDNTKKNEWNLSNLPPKDHEEVAKFAHKLFEIAKLDKERLGKPDDFIVNYALYRGDTDKPISGKVGRSNTGRSNSNKIVPINLYFANVERTVSNITARAPVGEIVDLDGSIDNTEEILSYQLKTWWRDSNQQLKTRTTARAMEIYGITIEKPIRNPTTNQPDIMITDPFSFFPAPGNWFNIAIDAPYICYIYQEYVSKIESTYGVDNIASDDTYFKTSQSRESIKSSNNRTFRVGNYTTPVTVSDRNTNKQSNKETELGVIIEVWVRDNSTIAKNIEVPVFEDDGITPQIDESGNRVMDKFIQYESVYPDGIRKISISRSKDPANNGWIILDDSKNPNINFNHLEFDDKVKSTYAWGKLPVYVANSYKDDISIWGFAAAEQVGDLIHKINLIMNKLIAYVINVMAPPLIIQQHCGITKEMIESSINKSGRMVLMPSIPNARIEFMQIPNLPATFFQVLDLIVRFFDRIYQIEDADRGVGPKGIKAASAIVALQERNQVLMQAKTSSIDYIAEERSKWAISFWQNWGTEENVATVNGEQISYRLVNYIGRKFNYTVESGSTTPRTSLQLQEMSKWLYEARAIGQRGLLEALRWPNYKEELMRTAESQLGQAFQVLIDAGLPEEAAIELNQVLQQIKFQTEDAKKTQQVSQPVQPKSLSPKESSVQSGA